LPALIYAGVPPVNANATSTMALWPGSVSAAFAYRRDITATRRWLAMLAAVSLAGGLIGALLLVRTSNTAFMRLLPWLMLVAAATFTFGSRRRPGVHRHHQPALIVLLLQFLISIYGGYFGGGMGIMMLATLSLAGLTDIHEMNGLKSVLGTAINGIALVEFIARGVIAWHPALVMIAGGMTGGYFGAHFSKKISRVWVRNFVVAVGWVMTIYFFIRP
jgi:uncharacterized membrane protein YfcA